MRPLTALEAEVSKSVLLRFVLGREAVADVDCYFHGPEKVHDAAWRADFFAHLTSVTSSFLVHPDVLEAIAGVGPRLGNVFEWETIVRSAHAGASPELLGRTFWRLNPIFTRPPQLEEVEGNPVGPALTPEFVARMIVAAQTREAEEAGEAQDLVLEMNQFLAVGDLTGALNRISTVPPQGDWRARRVIQRSLQRVYAAALDARDGDALAICLDEMSRLGACNSKDIASAIHLFRYLEIDLEPPRLHYWLESQRVVVDSHLALAVVLALGRSNDARALQRFVAEHWNDDFDGQAARFTSCALEALADGGLWSDVLARLPEALEQDRVDPSALRHLIRRAKQDAQEEARDEDLVPGLKEAVLRHATHVLPRLALLTELSLSSVEQDEIIGNAVDRGGDEDFLRPEFESLLPALMEQISSLGTALRLVERVTDLAPYPTARATWLQAALKRGQQPSAQDVDQTLAVLPSATPYVQGLVLLAVVEAHFRSESLEEAFRAYACLPKGRVTGVIINVLDYLVSSPTEDSLELVRFVAQQLPDRDEQATVFNVLMKRSAQADARDLQASVLDEMRRAKLPISRYTLGPSIRMRERAGLLYRDDQEVVRPDAHEWTDLQVLLDDVIHELNQPLATAGLSLSTLRRAIAASNQDVINESSARLESAIRQLGERIAVYRSMSVGADDTDDVDVALLLQQLAEVIAGPAAEAGVVLDFVVEPENPWGLLMRVRGNAFQLRLALRGLLMNSIQAMALAGTTRPVLRVQALVSLPVDDPRPVVDIWVRDNGPGIPDEIRERIFERGFTTKKGRGLGLGLSLASAVIRGHGGQIALTSQPEDGAEFFIRLPLATTQGSNA